MLQFTAPGGLFAPEPPLRQSVVVPVGLTTAGLVVDEIAPARAIGTITSAATARVARPAIRRRRPCRPFVKALPPCTAPALGGRARAPAVAAECPGSYIASNRPRMATRASGPKKRGAFSTSGGTREPGQRPRSRRDPLKSAATSGRVQALAAAE